jgi:hypothetical protein
MDGHSQRFQERSFRIGDGVGKPVNPVFRDHKIGGKPSLAGAVLVSDVLAEMILSLKAEIACPAGNHRFNSHPISQGNPCYGLAFADNFAGKLVADGHGQGGHGMLASVKVNISAADTASLDL